MKRVVTFLCLIPFLVLKADSYRFSKEINSSFNNQIGEISKEGLNDVVPGYSKINKKEIEDLSSLRTNSSLFKEKVDKEARSNKTTQFVQKSSDSRPEYDINPETDPIIKNRKRLINSSHKITETYSGCEPIKIGEFRNDENSRSEFKCYEKSYRQFDQLSCSSVRSSYCSNKDADKLRFFKRSDFVNNQNDLKIRVSDYGIKIGEKRGFRAGFMCQLYENVISFNLENDEIVDFMEIVGVHWDDWVEIKINGINVFKQKGKKCEGGTFHSKKVNIDLKNYLKKGKNVLHLSNYVAGTGGLLLELRGLKRVKCLKAFKWKRSCDKNINLKEWTIKKERCLKFDSSKGCSRRKETWVKEKEPIYKKSSICKSLERKSCYVVSKKCITHDLFCRKKELTYTCPQKQEEDEVLLCGDELICKDGECANDLVDPYDTEDDFKKATASIALAKDLSKEFSKQKDSIFDGKVKKCLEKEVVRGVSLKTKKCCPFRNGGVLVDLSLHSCNGEEKSLVDDFSNETQFHVGNYSIKKRFTKKYFKSFCVYPSKLAKVIVREARGQLGLSFGSAENPNCEGLKIEQFKKIDFERINLDELYDDFFKPEEFKKPDLKKQIERIKKNIKRKSGG